ncbi:heme o synthase [Candidatus Profftia lariciata]|uniref:heme o synthase n=1 Tax=Candidatus Profftia lariciata TaxID=1987921 RepID=UPI001D0329E8|nr:heme o synthase [Candidatus Profftia lariciata]
MIKQYLQIIKPGIIFGNIISVIGGFLLASKGRLDIPIFIYIILGISFVIASACIFNNYIDRDIDKVMERTKHRVFVKGLISSKITLIYAILLGIIGIIILYLAANPLTVVLALIGFIVYVVIYSLYMKRKSIYGTLIGSLSGAMPPIIGYCAVNKDFDTGALILLTIFCSWQMPHSYAIAIFRFTDYQKAKIPVLPVMKGITVTKKHITIYILVFMGATMMLPLAGYVNYQYFTVVVVVSSYWLYLSLSGYRKKVNNFLWARKMFLFSIVTIIILNIIMSINY